MISILIPIYNYNAAPLVGELHNQCMEEGLEFEIICIDDCSTDYKQENNSITALNNCTYHFLELNIGRSKIRNLLASRASKEWLLFLDCDVFPENKFFIKTYANHLKQSLSQSVYGGLQYQENKPIDNQLLRWVYGQKREVKSTSFRRLQPYQTSLVSNFFIQKVIFAEIQFDDSVLNYGYEDTIFIQFLKNKNVIIDQIDNPVLHLKVETSAEFLIKTKEALKTLLFLNQSKIKLETKLLTTFSLLKKFRLVAITAAIFSRLSPILENNLLAKKPSMFVFDLYKIGYFCYLNKK